MDEQKNENNSVNEVVIVETEDVKITSPFIRTTDNGSFIIRLHCKGVIPYGYWIRSAAINGVMCEPYDNFLAPTEEGDMDVEIKIVYAIGTSRMTESGNYSMPAFKDVSEIKLDVVVLEDDGSYGDVDEPDDSYANQHGIAGKYIATIFPQGRPENPEYTIGGVRGVLFDTDEYVIFIKDIADSERTVNGQKIRTKRVYIAAINKTDKEMYISTHSSLINGEEAQVSHMASRLLPGLSAIDAVQYIRPEAEFNNEIKLFRFGVAVQVAEKTGPKLLMNNAVEIKL